MEQKSKVITPKKRNHQVGAVSTGFFSQTSGYLYHKNIDLTYLGCNQNYAALLGEVSSKKIIGKMDKDFKWPAELIQIFSDDEQFVIATKQKQQKEYEIPVENYNRKTLHILVSRTPLLDEQGKVIGVEGLGLDITEYKICSNKSNEERILTEDILYNLPGLIYWKNRQSQYMGFNRNVVELSGLTREELKGKTDGELNWGKKEGDSFKKDDQEVIETGIVKITEHEIPIKRSDGNPTIIRTEKSQLRNKAGEIIGVLGVALDITEQKLLEKKLAQIRSNEEKELIHNLGYIVDHMPGYIYWKDKCSRYMGCNHNLAIASGLNDSTEIVGKTDYDFEWGKEKAEQFIADDKMVMEQKTVLTTEYMLSIKRSDGKELVVRTDKMPLYNKSGDVIGVLAIAVDITEQKALESALVQEKERVEKLSQAKTAFIRNMEHDIRTPFGGIYTIADALEKQEEDKGKKEYLNAITQCAKELLDYCNNILDFSRLEAGTLPLANRKFDLQELLQKIIKIETPAAQAKKLELIFNYAEELPKILIGDPYRLQRILINLISNAIKFTHHGTVKLTTELAAHPSEGRFLIIRFFIVDTGIGIAEEHQAYIYEPLQRLSPSNKGAYKGSGLGLTIAKQLLEELQGEIDVHSVLNEGTTFVCTIPFKQPLVSEVLYNDDRKIDAPHQ